jgi:hypothetical protein
MQSGGRMIVYVLTKQYADKSGFIVCGVTEKLEIAQAFEAGGLRTDPMPVIYHINTEEALMPEGHPGMVGAL